MSTTFRQLADNASPATTDKLVTAPSLGADVLTTYAQVIGVFGIVQEASHVVSIYSGTNAQTLRVYNTRTSATNFERGAITWNSNVLEIGSEKGGGGGSSRAVRLKAGTYLTFATADVDRGYFDPDGMFSPNSNNVYDIGVTGTRWRTGYFGTSIITPFVQQTATRSRLVSAVTNVTTTLANLTELSVTLGAGRKYTGTLVLPINQALAADGYKLDLGGGTASFTSIHFGFDSAIGVTVGTRTSTSATTPLTLTALADTFDVYITVQITMVVNAGGTFIPRQAKNADAAGATLTHRVGGYLWLEDMPA